MNKWFDNALFYEIYPTSFMDSNDDGIGDLKGITSKLEYVKDLGLNAIWLNPFYKSPFKDGGYDISDYYEVDPRFGTMDDFEELIKKAHSLGIHIIVDLVPGHTSEMNPMFLESSKPDRNKYSDMFIWNDNVWNYQRPYILISGRYDRNASYMVNFFSHQPALNYGFKKVTYPEWQLSYKDERTFIARDLMKDVMKFWLSHGCDGFRVDMADSLVKDDDDKEATIEVWKSIIPEVKKEYPDCFLVSEWSNPDRSLRAGFDADFVLDHWDNFAHRLARSTEKTRGTCVLNGGETDFFVNDLIKRVNEAKKNNGYISFISGNHDTSRIASFLDEEKLRIFYLMEYTLPGIPFLYYGDEIGMKHRDMNSKDGGYQRTGDRTPMEWDDSVNRGFSNTKNELYLPVGNETCNVKDEEKDPNSLLNYIKKIISFRKENPNLVNNNLTINVVNNVITYTRDTLKIIINLSKNDIEINGNVLISTTDNAVVNGKLKVNQAVVITK